MIVKMQLHPLDVTYRILEGKAVIHIFGKTVDNKQICVIDESFEPYFWIILKDSKKFDSVKNKLMNIEIEQKKGVARVNKVEKEKKKFLGEEYEALKVYCNLPKSVPAIRDAIKEWDVIQSIHEYDIPFARRYLIDKGIIPLNLIQVEGELDSKNYKVDVLKANSVEPFSEESIKEPKILAFDIETYHPPGEGINFEKNPILMISFHGKRFNKVLTWKKFKTKHDYIVFLTGEEDLIKGFVEVLETYKPDLLVGYFSDGFDLPYIKTRAEKYNIKLNVGLDNTSASIERGRYPAVKINGIVHLDILSFIRRVLGRSLSTDSYSLTAVSKELLGDQKIEVELDNLQNVWDNKPEGLEIFCEYNLHDSVLAYKLCEKILPSIEELVRIIGLTLFDVNRMAFSQLVEWYLLRRALEFNELAPNKPHHNELVERRNETYTGGFVFNPKPGLYKDIVVFDFRSLYPTIIASLNISLETLNCECCKEKAEKVPIEKNEYWFCKKKKGFLPTIIEDLITRRMRINEIIKKKSNIFLEARSMNLKLLANSFYGYLGFYGARWYSVECARSVTAYGRHYIQDAIKKAEEAGFNTIYGDTDSVFLTLDGKKLKDAKDFVETINTKLPGIMELEYEEFYPSGIFVSAKVGVYGAKKRYALLTEKGTLKIKGFESVRRNWSIIGKEVQEHVLELILKDDNVNKALKYVTSVLQELKDKKIPKEKVIISTMLQRDVKSYDAKMPHVAVAERMEKKGIEVGPGTLIKFIVTTGKGVIRNRAKMPDEVKEGSYDSEYYITKQVLPTVERIFEVLGHTKEEILEGKKQQKLDSFFG